MLSDCSAGVTAVEKRGKEKSETVVHSKKFG